MATKTLQLPPYLKALAVLSLLILVIFILIIGKSILIPLALAAFFAVLFTPMSLFFRAVPISEGTFKPYFAGANGRPSGQFAKFYCK